MFFYVSLLKTQTCGLQHCLRKKLVSFEVNIATKLCFWSFFLYIASHIISINVGAEGKSVNVYFPMVKWYDWYSYEAVTNEGGVYQSVITPLDHVPVSCRTSVL